MDPKVEKLLEGKSEEERFQAIIFAIACASTRPKANTSREAPIFSGELRRCAWLYFAAFVAFLSLQCIKLFLFLIYR